VTNKGEKKKPNDKQKRRNRFQMTNEGEVKDTEWKTKEKKKLQK
jgi:hypothetical protein